MTWLDYTLFAVVSISALYSVFRGFVNEVLSLLSWVLSFWIAIKFSAQTAGYLEGIIETPGIRFMIAFVMLLVLILVVGAVCSRVIVRLVKRGGFSGMDRLIGVVFGLTRGLVIASLLLMLGRVTPLAAERVWHESMTVAYFEQVHHWVTKNIPRDFVTGARDWIPK